MPTFVETVVSKDDPSYQPLVDFVEKGLKESNPDPHVDPCVRAACSRRIVDETLKRESVQVLVEGNVNVVQKILNGSLLINR